MGEPRGLNRVDRRQRRKSIRDGCCCGASSSSWTSESAVSKAVITASLSLWCLVAGKLGDWRHLGWRAAAVALSSLVRVSSGVFATASHALSLTSRAYLSALWSALWLGMRSGLACIGSGGIGRRLACFRLVRRGTLWDGRRLFGYSPRRVLAAHGEGVGFGRGLEAGGPGARAWPRVGA